MSGWPIEQEVCFLCGRPDCADVMFDFPIDPRYPFMRGAATTNPEPTDEAEPPAPSPAARARMLS